MIKKLSMALGIVLLFLFSSTVIQAQQFLTMPSCAFRPNDEDVTYTYGFSYAFADPDSPGVNFYAPVYLPQDATIVSVTLSYDDTNVDNDIEFYVSRTNLYTRITTFLFMGNSSGSAGYGTVIDSTLNGGSRVVKNNSFHYTACIYIPIGGVGPSSKFCTLKIKYQ